MNSSSGSSSEDDDDDLEVFDSQQRQHGGSSRKRHASKHEKAQDVEDKSYHVCAVFGKGEEGAEVWLGVRVAKRGKKKNKVTLQFLQEVRDKQEEEEGPMYELLAEQKEFDEDMIEHTFDSVPFIEITTYKLTKRHTRMKAGKKVDVRTKKPLNKIMMADLGQRCAAAAVDLDADSDSD